MDRLYETDVTVPASTASSSPYSVDWPLEDATLVYVNIIIPAGHSGLTGIRLTRSGTQIVPYSSNSWIISDDEKLTIGFNDEITSSGVKVVAYNSDIFAHTFYLRALIRDLPAPSSSSPAITAIYPNDALSTFLAPAG